MTKEKLNVSDLNSYYFNKYISNLNKYEKQRIHL